MTKDIRIKNGKLPETPGVYVMKNAVGGVLYVGKAVNLKRRVESYFARAHEYRIEKLVSEIRRIDYEKTDTAIEALILESQLIKKYEPPYNVRDKDDKSFLYVEITKEKFPRVLLVRATERIAGERFGPFTSATALREAMKILRRIFPWSVHGPQHVGKFKRPCFDYEIGLCPGTCVGRAERREYRKTIRNVRLIFQGKRSKIITLLEREMRSAARSLDFEKAEKIRRQVFGLRHIQDIAVITADDVAGEVAVPPARIEGYDISNISGTSAVGSMVVFRGAEPSKSEYRKFKIKTVEGSNDVGMLKEVFRRRFAHTEGARLPSPPPDSLRASKRAGAAQAAGGQGWPLPDIILVDGGAGQINACKLVLREYGLTIPVMGIAKGPKRKRNDIIGLIPRGISRDTLIRVRDESHRFAIRYHKAVRKRTFLNR